MIMIIIALLLVMRTVLSKDHNELSRNFLKVKVSPGELLSAEKEFACIVSLLYHWPQPQVMQMHRQQAGSITMMRA